MAGRELYLVSLVFLLFRTCCWFNLEIQVQVIASDEGTSSFFFHRFPFPFAKRLGQGSCASTNAEPTEWPSPKVYMDLPHHGAASAEANAMGPLIVTR